MEGEVLGLLLVPESSCLVLAKPSADIFRLLEELFMSFKSELAALLPHDISYFDWYLISRTPRYVGGISRADRRAVQHQMRALVVADAHLITDAPSQGHLLVCALVHALYERLNAKGMTPSQAVGALTTAFQQPGGLSIKLIMRLALFFAPSKRAFVEKGARDKARTQYGEQFQFEEESDEKCFVSVVKRCAYFDYFQRHQLQHLTAIFCAWDALWIDALERDKSSGVLFNRPTTLGWGGDCCRFEFYFDQAGKGVPNAKKR